MQQIVGKILIDVFSNPLIMGFIVVMLILAIIDFKSLDSPQHRDFKSAIVSIGILGTFFGIFLGLYEFRTSDIAGSVPELLEGLKLAFATSITGLFLSIVLFVWQKFKAPVADDDLGLLKEISQKLNHLGTVEHATMETAQQLREFRMDIGEEQKRLRRFIEENFSKTNQSLERAIESLSKGATAEIIKSLEQVIDKFNIELQHQFGDNFKKLNESVLKLLEWQENYKSHVESSEKLLQEIANALINSKRAFEDLVDRSKETQDIYDKLKSIIETYHSQTASLNTHLESFARLGERAEKSFTTLDEGFKKINSDVKGLTDEIRGTVTGQSDSLKKLTQELNKQLPESLGELEKTLVGLTRKFASDYEVFLQRLSQLTSSGR